MSSSDRRHNTANAGVGVRRWEPVGLAVEEEEGVATEGAVATPATEVDGLEV